jgi:hypothetical protein
MSLRKVRRPASKITATPSASLSAISFITILVKPKTALTGVPSARVIGGRAKNARKI